MESVSNVQSGNNVQPGNTKGTEEVGSSCLGLHVPATLEGVAPDLEQEIAKGVQSLIEQGDFSSENIHFVKNFILPASSGSLLTSDELLERLRHAAQIWDVSLKPKEITSHRRFVGPIIVSLKRLIYPVLSFFLADTLRQQRDFNAAVLRCLVELSHERGQR